MKYNIDIGDEPIMDNDFIILCRKAKDIIKQTNNSSPSLLMVRLNISLETANRVLQYLNQCNYSTGVTSIPQKDQIDFDSLDGHSFEYFCADILLYNGFTNIQVTQGSGDFGVDILCFLNGIAYAIQCKCYSSTVGNKSVQEVYSGKTYYNCQKAIVITNNYFTPAAEETARMTNVELWDRHRLKEMVLIAYKNGYIPKKY